MTGSKRLSERAVWRNDTFDYGAGSDDQSSDRRWRFHVAARVNHTDAELKYAALDVSIGMIFCNVVFYFVILGTAATLHVAGKTDMQSATDAAQALRPLAGNASTILFALGIIGAGFLAVPLLTGSGAYAIAEALGWEYGLDAKPSRAKPFYAAIAISTAIGIVINFIGINPMKALFWTAVIDGFLADFFTRHNYADL